MKKAWTILMLASGILLAQETPVFRVLECGELAVYGREMADGSYVEEIVNADHPARFMTLETHADVLTPVGSAVSYEPLYEQEVYFSVSAADGEYTARLGVDLLAWRRNAELNRQLQYEHGTRTAAVTNGDELAQPAQAPPQPGILRRTSNFVVQQYQDHPIRSTLVTIGSILLLDYWEGGGIDAFGILARGGSSEDPGSSGGVILNANTRGEASPVNITILTGDGSTAAGDQPSTRTDSTAAPFFPPQ